MSALHGVAGSAPRHAGGGHMTSAKNWLNRFACFGRLVGVERKCTMCRLDEILARRDEVNALVRKNQRHDAR